MCRDRSDCGLAISCIESQTRCFLCYCLQIDYISTQTDVKLVHTTIWESRKIRLQKGAQSGRPICRNDHWSTTVLENYSQPFHDSCWKGPNVQFVNLFEKCCKTHFWKSSSSYSRWPPPRGRQTTTSYTTVINASKTLIFHKDYNTDSLQRRWIFF